MDLGTLLTLLKLATESGALAKPDPKPIGIADLPIPLFEGEAPPTPEGFGLECGVGKDGSIDTSTGTYKCRVKGFH
jgi:hypothetical protein